MGPKKVRRNNAKNITQSGIGFARSGFTHNQLKYPEKQIRLLRFLPDESANDLRLTISTYMIGHTPRYVAISYTWGDETYKPLHIDRQVFNVRINCYQALQQARLHHPDAFVWIDSICINQNDMSEKGFQVRMMGAIYEGAVRILACVGPHDASSNDLLLLLKGWARIDRKKIMVLDFPKLTPSSDVEDFMGVDNLQSLEAFLSRPYFNRLWIVQELAAGDRDERIESRASLASQEYLGNVLRLSLPSEDRLVVDFLFGERIVSKLRLDEISRAVFKYYIWKHSSTSERLKAASRYASALSGLKLHSISVQEICTRFNKFQCLDSRDRIYGVLAMVDWRQTKTQLLLPDYQKSALDLALELCEHVPFSSLAPLLESLGVTTNNPSIREELMERSRTVCERPAHDPISQHLMSGFVHHEWRCSVLAKDRKGRFRAMFPDDSAYDRSHEHMGRAENLHEAIKTFPGYNPVYALICGSPTPKAIICQNAQPGDWLVPIHANSQLGLLVVRHGIGESFEIIGLCLPLDIMLNVPSRSPCRPFAEMTCRIWLHLIAEDCMILALGAESLDGCLSGVKASETTGQDCHSMTKSPIASTKGVVHLRQSKDDKWAYDAERVALCLAAAEAGQADPSATLYPKEYWTCTGCQKSLPSHMIFCPDMP